MCALKESLISSSLRAKTAENQIENLILRLSELQHKLNFPSYRMPTDKVRILIQKE
jgi:hypothetical protein